MTNYEIENATKTQLIAEVNSFLCIMGGREAKMSSAAKSLPIVNFRLYAKIVEYAREDGPEKLNEWYRNITGRIADATNTASDLKKADAAYNE